MATDRNFIEYVHEQSGLGDALTFRKMFGEYGLYFDGRMPLVAADNRLFLKPTQAGRALVPRLVEEPFYPGSALWFVIDECIDDSDLLQRLIRATAAELPLPAPKSAKKSKKSRKATKKSEKIAAKKAPWKEGK